MIPKLKNLLPIVFVASFFIISLYLKYYKDGAMIVGGEGSYFTDFIQHINNYGFTWYNTGTGFYAISLNFIFHLSIIQLLLKNETIVNFCNIFLIYFLPFIISYFLSIKLKLKTRDAFLVSLFYIVNPFSTLFLESINPWNMLALYILPANFFIIYSFYSIPKTLFLIFGLHSAFFNFVNANPPTMAIIQLGVIISLVIVILKKEKHFNLPQFLKKYFLILASFLLFNLWWIINLLLVINDAQLGYTRDYALHWLDVGGRLIPTFWRAISLTSLLSYPINPQYDYFSYHYSQIISPLILLLPIFIIIINRPKKTYQNFIHFALLGFIFISRGTSTPFSFIYTNMVMHLPLFHIFKSAAEKWGLLVIFLFFLGITFILKNQNKHHKITRFILILYLFFCSIPFVTNNYIPEAKRDINFIQSKKYFNKPEYQQLKKELNLDPALYRTLSLPGSLNYQIALKISENKYCTGNDPILTNTNKPFIAPYKGNNNINFDLLFTDIDKNNYFSILSLFNIKKIIINKDVDPWFGTKENKKTEELIDIFDQSFNREIDNSSIITYDIGQYFLPRFYIPKKIIFSDKNLPLELSEVIGSATTNDRPAIFSEDNRDDSLNTYQPLPQIIFVKINPTKYKIKVSKAQKPFILVFSESFHPGWNLYYNGKISDQSIYQDKVREYFSQEITEGEHKNILFNTSIFETIFKKPINKHYQVNGYANAWLIEPTDGREFEIIVEYTPQRYFYLGTIIFVITTLAGVILIIKKK